MTIDEARELLASVREHGMSDGPWTMEERWVSGLGHDCNYTTLKDASGARVVFDATDEAAAAIVAASADVPALCNALEEMTARAEKAEAVVSAYKRHERAVVAVIKMIGDRRSAVPGLRPVIEVGRQAALGLAAELRAAEAALEALAEVTP